MKAAIQRTLTAMGYEVRRSAMRAGEKLTPSGILLAGLEAELAVIPGMISTRRGAAHYLMAYTQTISGDIVEIGSWQGRNTSFLAAACRDSENGIVHAIDHFRGNPGKEHAYVVEADDLSDLEPRFRVNIERAGLSEWVQLHACEAQDVEVAGPVRLLFIDGEHSYDAVNAELAQFAPLLAAGALVVFDDYTPEFPGVVEAVNDWVAATHSAVPVQLERSLVVKLV